MKGIINSLKIVSIKFFLIIISLYLLHGCLSNKVDLVSNKKPNVIFIMADDVGIECFNSYGGESYKTPRLDKLAQQGLLFNHCYSTPLCTPSRVKLMTGKYSFRNYSHFGYLNTESKTFGNMMRQAGYKTAIAGKWQLNGLYYNVPDKDSGNRSFNAGFDESLLWQLTKTANKGERYWNPLIEHNGKPVKRSETYGKYGPDLFTDFICDFIEKNKNNPFFVYYPMVLPHNPFVATPDSNVKRKKEHYRFKSTKYFPDMLSYMDKLVGTIVDKLESLNLLKDTIVIFTSDNGTYKKVTSSWKGKKVQGGKGALSDFGTRVPLIIYWKGKTAQGKRSNSLIDFTDFYASLMDITGIKINDSIDGVSFYPELLGKKGKNREWIMCYYQPYWPYKAGKFIRTKNYKLYGKGNIVSVSNGIETSLKHSKEEKVIQKKEFLQNILNKTPPIAKSAGKNAKIRKTFPQVTLPKAYK